MPNWDHETGAEHEMVWLIQMVIVCDEPHAVILEGRL